MAISTPPHLQSFTSSSSSSDTDLSSPLSLPMGSLRRSNTIASVVPSQLEIPEPDPRPKSSSFPTGEKRFLQAADFEVVSLTLRPQAYTSLKDVLSAPATKAVAAYNCSDISIRNRLVKHAAWAYLQPMASPSSSDSHFFRRLWAGLSTGSYFLEPVSACIGFFQRHVFSRIASVFDRLLGAFRMGQKTAVLS